MSARRGGRAGLAPLAAVLAQSDARHSRAEAPPVELTAWEAAVGSRIAARARPVRLERGTLHVVVATATWCQELALMSEAIIAQLAARGLAVRSLRFRVGQVATLDRDGQTKRLTRPEGDAHRRSPPEAALPRPIADALAEVDDAELRGAIRKAAAKNLGWQAMNTEPPRAPAPAAPRPSRPNAATSEPQAEPRPRGAAPRSDPSGRASGSASSPRRTRE